MNSQLYTAASGLQVEERRVETIANNLANIKTDGYRSRRTFHEIFRNFADPTAAGLPANRAIAVAGMYESHQPGPQRPTGRPLDIALRNGDLMVVESDEGRRYTRAGSLEVGDQGVLTDRLGHPVLDTEGSTISGLTPSSRIRSDGSVVDGEAILGRLQIVRDPQELLVPTGRNLLSAEGRDTDMEPVADPVVNPGFVETSGTNPMDEMVRMIQAQRAFQSYQKLISLTMNEVNRRAVNEIAGR